MTYQLPNDVARCTNTKCKLKCLRKDDSGLGRKEYFCPDEKDCKYYIEEK